MSLDELTALEAKVKAQREDLQKSLRLTIIVYIILAVIVVVYTNVVVAQMKKATSPEAIAEMAKGKINEQAPLQRERLIAAISENKDDWSDAAMGQLHASLPALEAQVEVLLDQLSGNLVEEIETRVMPKFAEFIKDDANTLKEQYKAATSDEIAEAYVEMFIEVIDKELSGFLDEKFINTCEKLQVDLHRLAKPGAKLTKKQDAQRRLIMAWAHLTEHQEFGEAIFTDLLATLKRKFEEATAEEDFSEEELDAVDELVEEPDGDGPIEELDQPLRLIPEGR